MKNTNEKKWECRGHWRHLKSGKVVWVSPHSCRRHDEDDKTTRNVPVVKSENIRSAQPLIDEILRNHNAVAVNSVLSIDSQYNISIKMGALRNGQVVPKATLPYYVSGARGYRGRQKFNVGFETYCIKVVAGFIAAAIAKQRGKGRAAEAYNTYNARTWIDSAGRRIIAIHNIRIAFSGNEVDDEYAFAYETVQNPGDRKSLLPTYCAILAKKLFNIARDIVVLADPEPVRAF